jgi:inhibitor of KinA sporulation pathway (predicted exonuclease)
VKIIVLDLEMNAKPLGGHIIQIGAVKLDLGTGEIGEEFCRYVRYPGEVLDQYIIGLTGITQEKIDTEGLSPEIAYQDFWNYVGNKTLTAWGKDIPYIMDASQASGIAPPVSLDVMNLQVFGTICRQALPSHKRAAGLVRTLESFGLAFEGKQHDAIVDAKNAARFIRLSVNMLRNQMAMMTLASEFVEVKK